MNGPGKTTNDKGLGGKEMVFKSRIARIMGRKLDTSLKLSTSTKADREQFRDGLERLSAYQARIITWLNRK